VPANFEHTGGLSISCQFSCLLARFVHHRRGVVLAATPLLPQAHQSTVGEGKTLERPSELTRKQSLTPSEASAYEKQLLQQGNRDRRDEAADMDLGRAYNEVWFDRGTKVVGSRRTRSSSIRRTAEYLP
jgi:hypothetical protein